MSGQDEPPLKPPTPAQTLGAMWLYTLLRFALFFVLWGLIWAARVPVLLAALIALVLSVPLSLVLLRKQRARMAANLQWRVMARQSERDRMNAQLAGHETDPPDPLQPDAVQPDALQPDAARDEPRDGRR